MVKANFHCHRVTRLPKHTLVTRKQLISFCKQRGAAEAQAFSIPCLQTASSASSGMSYDHPVTLHGLKLTFNPHCIARYRNSVALLWSGAQRNAAQQPWGSRCRWRAPKTVPACQDSLLTWMFGSSAGSCRTPPACCSLDFKLRLIVCLLKLQTEELVLNNLCW